VSLAVMLESSVRAVLACFCVLITDRAACQAALEEHVVSTTVVSYHRRLLDHHCL